MNAALWIAQSLLAVTFLFHGYIKIDVPDNLPSVLLWIYSLPPNLLLFIGISELAGAAGVVLPALTRIQPRLTVWAAVGLATVMVLAAGWHITRGETMLAGINAVLFVLAAFVAYGRGKLIPIQPR